MEAGRLTSLDENLHGSCFDVCVARGGCGRMKPASSNFSAPRTYVFDLIGGTGAGTTDSIRDFLRGIFRRVAPKPKRPSRTPNRTQWRREDKSQSSRVRQHRARRATERVSPSVVWLSAHSRGTMAGMGGGQSGAEIYTYEAPWLVYAMNWSVSARR